MLQNMLDLSIIEEDELKDQCRQFLGAFSDGEIIKLAKAIFPVQSTPKAFDLLYKNINSYYTIRINKKIQFDAVTQQILKKAQDSDSKLSLELGKLFKSNFMQRLKRKITKSRAPVKPVQKKEDNTERAVINFSSNQLSNGSNVIAQTHTDNRSISSNDSLKGSAITKLPQRQLKRQPLKLASNSSLNSNLTASESGIVTNLSDQDMCLCGKHVSLIQTSKQPYFECFHCQKKYHTECMKRPVSSKTCSFCHLRQLTPNKHSKRTIFVGLLLKGRKKHQISFYLTEEDLSAQFKIQIRSFRIKEGCQMSVLFPDSVTFLIKNNLVKQFGPLHKLSSLKYRKDEPFYLTSGLHFKENKLTILQKHPSKDTKDERIQLETHLLGIYLIEEKKVDWMIREIKEFAFTQFLESKSLLEQSFKLDVTNEISCQLLKVSLVCSLTAEKIKLPVRGIFCSHFQCFDLKNFLQLTVNSTNPRFACPICKLPAYQYKIDTILHSILQVHLNNEVSELVIMKNGQFVVYSSQMKQCDNPIHNIFDLPIDGKYRKGNIQRIFVAEESPKKKSKSELVIV